MNFQIVPLGSTAVRVVMRGRADAAAIDGVEAALCAQVRDSAGNVVLDMAEVPFMGSLGIRMLIAMTRLVTRRGGRVAMTGVQPQVLEVFETMALFDLIPHAQDSDAALALLAG